MKKLIFVFVSVLSISLLTSCNKEETVTDDSLIEEIETSSNKVNVEPEALPSEAQQIIEAEYFETYVETVSMVDNKGYEITMGNEDVMYCNMRGEELRGRDRQHGPHRPGPCGRGEPVNVEDLPATITDYITANYPNADILRAKLIGSKYLVKISGHMILVFEENGTFLLEAPIFRFCDHFVDRINIDNLPEVILNYIAENYPNAEVKIAWKVRGKIVVGIITPDGRKIVVFDLDGNFLFERG